MKFRVSGVIDIPDEEDPSAEHIKEDLEQDGWTELKVEEVK